MSRDDGVAKLSNGVPISKETKDRIEKIDWTKYRNAKKLNPDMATSEDLRTAQWSGFRRNDYTGMCELWVVGRIAVSRRLQEIAANPGVLADMHEAAFSTNGTIIITDGE